MWLGQVTAKQRTNFLLFAAEVLNWLMVQHQVWIPWTRRKAKEKETC